MNISSLEEQMKLIKKNVWNIEKIDNPYEDVCLYVVKYNGLMISCIDKKSQTEKVCIEAVKEHPLAIKYIDKEKQTEEVCIEAVKRNGCIMQYIDKEKQTEKVCIKAVKGNRSAIQYIDKEKQTEELCLIAVKEHPLAIEYIDKEKITEEIFMQAFNNDTRAIEFISKEKRTKEMCWKAIKEHGRLIKYVPKEIITEEMCWQAIKQDYYAIWDIPKEIITEEMCLQAIRKNSYLISNIPKEMLTEKICIEAFKNDKICLEIIKCRPSLMKIISKNVLEDLCLKSIKLDAENIRYIKNKTPKLCMYAFLNNSKLLDKKYIKSGVDKFIKKEKLNNIVCFVNVNRKYTDIKLIENLFDENKYDFIDLDLVSFQYLREFILQQNENNHFLVDDKADLNILNDIALSNNELIIIDNGNITNAHKKIANKIITA